MIRPSFPGNVHGLHFFEFIPITEQPLKVDSDGTDIIQGENSLSPHVLNSLECNINTATGGT